MVENPVRFCDNAGVVNAVILSVGFTIVNEMGDITTRIIDKLSDATYNYLGRT
jgi:hypothetical protein